MSFTLHQLDVFAEVAKQKSMTKAAEKLFMSQPAVSIQVKKIQEHFGVDLFEVIGKELYLTEAGKELYEAQKNIKKEVNSLEMALSEIKGMMRGSLNVAVVSTAKYFMPYILGAFRSKFDKIKISLKVTDRNEVKELLRENVCDLAVFSVLPPELDLEAVEFLENPLLMASAPDHPLALKKNIDFKELEAYRFLIREPGSGTRMVMQQLFESNNISPEIVMELGTNEAVKQAIMAGIGISLISKYSLTLEESVGKISVLDVNDLPYVNTWKLVYPKGKRLSPAAKNFIEFTTTASLRDILK
ncbi:LysR family transcriptional regulator [Gracilimonas tropica]|uniref:LysR family transcriptional regulator n=1 Tax=Gracilimonas tropica TaxID=454600 RepID=UPI000363154A|nr:LysR family transcriptional regulator [Gracilimonas tropica]